MRVPFAPPLPIDIERIEKSLAEMPQKLGPTASDAQGRKGRPPCCLAGSRRGTSPSGARRGGFQERLGHRLNNAPRPTLFLPDPSPAYIRARILLVVEDWMAPA